MPTPKTECTELSVGFGLLQCDPTSIASDTAVKLWDGTLDQETFLDYVTEFQSNETFYRKFYNIVVNLACSHKTLARSRIIVRWEGPRQRRVLSCYQKIYWWQTCRSALKQQ
jgi:hypothetical protein